jgi:hypothetical protein
LTIHFSQPHGCRDTTALLIVALLSLIPAEVK